MTQKVRSLVGVLVTLAIPVFALLFSFVATAHAATGAEVATESIIDQAGPVFDAVMAGKYWYAAALALMVVVAFVQRNGTKVPVVGKYLTWTKSSWGAPLLVVLASVTGALATALAAGAAPSLGMLWAALGIAVGAGGAWKFGKEIGGPLLRAIRDKLPAPLRPLVSVALWALERAFSNEARVKKAEAAGDAAVKKNPPTGLDGVTGPATEIE